MHTMQSPRRTGTLFGFEGRRRGAAPRQNLRHHSHRWLQAFCLALLVLAALVVLPRVCGTTPESARPFVLQARLDNEAITPATARYLHRAIQQAQDQGAQCLVIMLDTPGGLVDSTRAIVKDILGSRVCVVVYVAPSSARAASAGVFITFSAHVAAMAPGTTIGAAHPVQLGGLPIGTQPSAPEGEEPESSEQKKSSAEKPKAPRTPMEEKIVNDTAAWARALAALRGRNEDWAEQAVRESVSVTDAVALKERVIDLVADDVPALLAAIDGREVALAHRSVTLHTAGAEIRNVDMWWGERLLAALSNPNVAFLLLIFGFYGILFELYTPGWGVAGTLGVVCLALAFFGLAVLPVNYVGLLLIALALGLFVAEVFVTSFGALTLAGVICLALGGVMLVDSPVGFLRVSMSVVAPVAAATALITVFLVGGIIRAHRKRVLTGSEALLGAEAVAQEPFSGAEGRYHGMVRAHGELWRAQCSAPVEAGDVLHVRDRRGLTLLVEPPRVEASSAATAGPASA
jgi:membrane-bound serine protease (ClpP class)